MSFKSDLNSLILASLQNGPLHGYSIAKHIRQLSSNTLKVGESAIYPALQELENEGYVTSQWEMQEGRPPRKSYSLTDSGESKLEQQKSAWESFVKNVNSVFTGKAAMEDNHA